MAELIPSESNCSKRSKPNPTNSPAQTPLSESPFDIISDDLLLEILIRVPDSRSVIRLTAVCHSWLSLIQSPEFRSAFDHFRRRRGIPFAFWFQFGSPDPDDVDNVLITHPVYVKTLETIQTSASLDFLPFNGGFKLRCSFNELLLVSNLRNPNHYYICNPLTKHWLHLRSPPPNFKPLIYGLSIRGDGAVRVVLVNPYNKPYPTNMVYSSETGMWTVTTVSLKNLNCSSGAASAGVADSQGKLHWLCGRRVLIFDPFERKMWTVEVPGRVRWLTYVSLGMCRGRLCLAAVDHGGEKRRLLRVWEHDDDKWCLKMKANALGCCAKKPSYVLGFHPSRNRVVFMRGGFRSVLRCTFSKPESGSKSKLLECKEVGRLPLEEEEEYTPFYRMFSCPLVYSPWPTPIPRL